jgi:hypothetical protein
LIETMRGGLKASQLNPPLAPPYKGGELNLLHAAFGYVKENVFQTFVLGAELDNRKTGLNHRAQQGSFPRAVAGEAEHRKVIVGAKLGNIIALRKPASKPLDIVEHAHAHAALHLHAGADLSH